MDALYLVPFWGILSYLTVLLYESAMTVSRSRDCTRQNWISQISHLGKPKKVTWLLTWMLTLIDKNLCPCYETTCHNHCRATQRDRIPHLFCCTHSRMDYPLAWGSLILPYYEQSTLQHPYFMLMTYPWFYLWFYLWFYPWFYLNIGPTLQPWNLKMIWFDWIF